MEKITVVTLYRGRTTETLVGAFRGTATAGQREALTERLDVRDSPESMDDPDTIGFAPVVLADGVESLPALQRAYPDEMEPVDPATEAEVVEGLRLLQESLASGSIGFERYSRESRDLLAKVGW